MVSANIGKIGKIGGEWMKLIASSIEGYKWPLTP